MIPKDYHSALSKEIKNLPELKYHTLNQSTVIQHDITSGVLEQFFLCDVVYAELAWQHGYEEFIIRAGVKSEPYTNYLKAIRSAILKISRPTFIIGGKHALKRLSPHYYTATKLHNKDAILMIWNHQSISYKDNKEVLNYLSKKYNTVLDFCCGYGHYLNQFNNFIAADINSKCVYYIAKKYLHYHKETT